VVLDVASGELVCSLVTNATKTLLSPDARWLAAARSDSTVALIHTIDGRLVRECVGHTDSIHSMAFSDDGSLLATGSADRTARVWRIATGEPVGPPLEHDGMVFRVVFRPGSQQLATVNPLGSSRRIEDPAHLQIWDYLDGTQMMPSR
jgi:WD40 repeat protein